LPADTLFLFFWFIPANWRKLNSPCLCDIFQYSHSVMFFSTFFIQMRISMACLPTALDYLLTQLHWMILWRKMVWHVLLVFSNLGISDSLLVERSLLPKLRRPASSLGEFLLGSELNWFRSELIFAASAAEIQGRGRQHLERIFGAAFWPHVAQRGLWVFGSENQHFERFTSLR
jgi:hypothetical protein